MLHSLKRLLAVFALNRYSSKLILLAMGINNRRILGYADIDGWLLPHEGVTLYKAARRLPNDHPVIVEIGSWLGKSSLCLAKGLEAKANPTLYCIDPFDATGEESNSAEYLEHQSRLSLPLKDVFIRNMQKHGVYDFIKVMHGYSHDFVASFADKIDLLFVDGNHDYEGVLRDYRDWSPLIKTGGIIAFHDVDRKRAQQGPWLVVQQEIMNNPQWRDTKMVGSVFLATKV